MSLEGGSFGLIEYSLQVYLCSHLHYISCILARLTGVFPQVSAYVET